MTNIQKAPTVAPIIRESKLNEDWVTEIYNDDETAYEAVIDILMVATKCSLEEAEIETWEAHNFGKAKVHFSTQCECVKVAETIQSIGVKAIARPEWEPSVDQPRV
jgi:ATP-dependent Clp protease adapter protein ClpS